MRGLYRSKLKKRPKRSRARTVSVRSYCRRGKTAVRRGGNRNQRGEGMPF